MATDISLHNYLKKLNQLLEENRYPEVVSHAQHILKQFSRHIPTYLVLGQALLEQQDFSGAIDLLQRVLSTKPNEFVAHLGLSIAYSEEGLYPQAMWHLLRANEMDPYNTNIQRELKEIYQQQGGEPLQDIPISQAALARLHFKGGQFLHAITGLQESLLATKEDRVDLELLLAEALWRDKQRIEAAELCDEILKKLPNCIDANAILAEIYLQGERTAKANGHLQLVQTLTQMDQVQLDVSTAVGAAFSMAGAIPLAEEIRLAQLEEETFSSFKLDEPTPTIADWVSEFGLDEALEGDADPYEWLHAPDESNETPPETAVSEGVPNWIEANLADDLEPIQLAPDQLEEWGASTIDEDLVASAPLDNELFDEETIPSWLQDVQPDQSENDTVSSAEEGIPDWLKSNPVNESQSFVATLNQQFDVTEDSVTDKNNKDKESQNVPEDAKAENPDDALSWLDDLIGQDNKTETPPTQAQAVQNNSEDLPDWLQNLSDKPNQPEAIPNEDLPDWLKEAALTTDTSLPGVLDQEAKEPDGSASSGLDDIAEAEISQIDTDLSWLDELSSKSAELTDDLPTMTWDENQAPNTTPAADAAEPQDFDEAMAWLEDLAADQTTPIEEPPTVDQGLFGTEILQAETADSNKPAEPSEENLPPEDIDDAMAWLEQLAANQGAPAEELPSIPDSEQETDTDEAMDWLEQLADESVAESAAASADAQVSPLADAARDATNSALDADLEITEPQDTMTWLEAIASNNDALRETSETAVVNDDLAAALDWLEAQTPARGPERSEETAVSSAELQSIDEELDWLEALATSDAPSQTTAADFELETPTTSVQPPLDMPEDPDEALAWLEQLATDTYQFDTQSSDADIGKPSQVEGNDRSETDDALKEEDLLNVPEDPDEAMAWLEQLAARQGAPVEELPSLSELPESEGATNNIVAEMPAVEEPAEDLNDAMSWLEQLATEQDEAVAELPSVEQQEGTVDNSDPEPSADITEIDSQIVAEVPDDPDEAMAWLEQLAARQGAPLEELPSVPKADLLEETKPATEDVMAEGAPEDLDDAMVWLEQLAADQGAPIDELPSLSEVSNEDAATVMAATAEADASNESIDDAMAWLDELATEQDAGDAEPETPIAPEAPDEAAVATEPEANEVEELSGEDDDAAEATLDAPPEDLDDAMAWLEQLAANQGAPVAELPSLSIVEDSLTTSEANEGSQAGSEDELMDDPMAWLDELASEQGVELEAAEDEPATPITDSAEDDTEQETADILEASEDPTLDAAPPEDLDDAMAWLEQLAANQGTPVEELPSLSLTGETSESSEADEPADEDLVGDPMAWLDELASEQGLELETESDAAEADSDDVAIASEEAETPESRPSVEDAVSDSAPPEDLDAAMAWLEQLAANQGAPLEELPSLVATEDGDASNDDALDWLNELASESDSDSESGKADAADETDVETAVVEAIGASTGNVELVETEEETDGVEDALAWLEEIAADESIFEDDPTFDSNELLEEAEADVPPAAEEDASAKAEEDLLPDWLAQEPPSSSVGDTGWLRSIAEPDMADWLTAEEEVTTGRLEQETFGTDALDDINEPEPLPEVEVPEIEGPDVVAPDSEASDAEATEVALDELPMEPPVSEPVSVLAVDEDQLSVARKAMDSGDVRTAVHSYQTLLESSSGLSILIADLENAAMDKPKQPQLHQLLGDAYLRNGQLQKAVNTYRNALNAL